ncbi:MAG: hypothetical protein ACT4PI_05690 [Actinomycetota bacterium]
MSDTSAEAFARRVQNLRRAAEDELQSRMRDNRWESYSGPSRPLRRIAADARKAGHGELASALDRAADAVAAARKKLPDRDDVPPMSKRAAEDLRAALKAAEDAATPPPVVTPPAGTTTAPPEAGDAAAPTGEPPTPTPTPPTTDAAPPTDTTPAGDETAGPLPYDAAAAGEELGTPEQPRTRLGDPAPPGWSRDSAKPGFWRAPPYDTWSEADHEFLKAIGEADEKVDQNSMFGRSRTSWIAPSRSPGGFVATMAGAGSVVASVFVFLGSGGGDGTTAPLAREVSTEVSIVVTGTPPEGFAFDDARGAFDATVSVGDQGMLDLSGEVSLTNEVRTTDGRCRYETTSNRTIDGSVDPQTGAVQGTIERTGSLRTVEGDTLCRQNDTPTGPLPPERLDGMLDVGTGRLQVNAADTTTDVEIVGMFPPRRLHDVVTRTTGDRDGAPPDGDVTATGNATTDPPPPPPGVTVEPAMGTVEFRFFPDGMGTIGFVSMSSLDATSTVDGCSVAGTSLGNSKGTVNPETGALRGTREHVTSQRVTQGGPECADLNITRERLPDEPVRGTVDFDTGKVDATATGETPDGPFPTNLEATADPAGLGALRDAALGTTDAGDGDDGDVGGNVPLGVGLLAGGTLVGAAGVRSLRRGPGVPATVAGAAQLVSEARVNAEAHHGEQVGRRTWRRDVVRPLEQAPKVLERAGAQPEQVAQVANVATEARDLGHGTTALSDPFDSSSNSESGMTTITPPPFFNQLEDAERRLREEAESQRAASGIDEVIL